MRHKRKECTVRLAGGNGSNSHGGSNKTCNHCGTKGCVKKDCWKKNPENAQAWYKTKKEASGASIEKMLASIKTKQSVMMSSIEAGNQAKADCEKDLQSIKALLEEIQLDEADVSEAYKVRDVAQSRL